MDELENLLKSYDWVLRVVSAKLDVLCESLKYSKSATQVSHITKRVKTKESLITKLENKGVAVTAENASKYLNDIAGIRIICPYAKDIYALAQMISEIPDVEVIKEKDYVSNAKKSGYRSYHMIIETAIFHSGLTQTLPVEIQIRTEGMNFWSSLEHQVKYKYKDDIPKHLSDELVICAEKIAELDQRMFLIHDIISLINE